ncbi:MAG: TonB-dependent siderophore receptor, partial [Methylocystaceae bacterium]
MLRPFLLRGVSVAALTFVLVSSPASAQEALPTIDVDAEASRSSSGLGPSGGRQTPSKETGYRRTVATTATKTDTPILDTPRSVVVIPKEVLQDNQVLNVQEAVKFVSGVQTAGAAYYDRYLIRGFQSGFTYRNGLKLSNVAGTEDVAFIDRVEILKGPSAMLYGRIQPGGLVNFVTKKPQEEAAYSLEEQFGSWGLSRTIADATGPLYTDKSLLYRVIGVYDRADDFVSFSHRDNGAVSAALTWKPTEQFEANFQAEYYNGKTTNRGYYRQLIPALALSYAVPGIAGRPANLPRNWTQIDPYLYGQLPDTLERIVLYADWTYRFNDSWKVSSKVHFDHNYEDQEYILSRGFDLATGNLFRRVSWGVTERNMWSLNLDLNGKFETGALAHNLLLGFDYFSINDFGKGDQPQGRGPEFPVFNIFAPYYGGVAWPVIQAEHSLAGGNIINRSKQEDFGYYIQDDISYDDKVHLLLGGRYDVAFDAASEIYGVSTASGSNIYGPATARCFPACDGHYNPPGKGNPTERKFSPNIGLLFKLAPEYSFFASYSESFGFSNSAVSFDNSVFPPQKGEQWEGGAKASLFAGRLTGSIVYFDLTMSNQLTVDPLHPSFSV